MRYSWLTGLAGLLCVLILASCRGKEQQSFIVEGEVNEAEGQWLYLEDVGTGNILGLDSVQLKGKGLFRFEHRAKSYPMFYRLRLGSSSIPFAADSATHLVLESGAKGFFSNYSIREGESYNYQIRDIALLRREKDNTIDSISQAYRQGHISQAEARGQIDSIAQGFKRHLCAHYIYVDPKSPVSYFALFQHKDGGRYFSVDDEGDQHAYAAVATAYDTYYPEAPYLPLLKELALEALAKSKERKARGQRFEQMSQRQLEAISFPEIALKDYKGQTQSLSELASKHSVLVSFTNYQAPWSPQLVSILRQLGEQRPDLKVYEVALESDPYMWRNATRNLPWLCLRDGEGKALRSYNVQTLPAFFLIEGTSLKRLSTPAELLKP